MTLTLRRAMLTDAPTIVEFNRRLAWESEQLELDPRLITPGVDAVLRDAAKGFYTVAEHNGEVVGQTLITTEWSDWRNGWFWWIQSVYVREDARRGGVFKALFEKLRAEALAEPSVIGIRLYLNTENERARKTYRSLNMTDTHYGMMEIYPLE
jgi:GNAT superfamily N-acetyltransferase